MKCNRKTCACLPSSNLNMVSIKSSACCFLEHGCFSPWENNQRVFGHIRYRRFHVSLEGFMSLWTGNFSSCSYYWKTRFVLSCFPTCFSNLCTSALKSKSSQYVVSLRACVAKWSNSSWCMYMWWSSTLRWRHINWQKLQYGFELTCTWLLVHWSN